MQFSQQEYWSRLPYPPPGDLPDPGMEHLSVASPAWQVDSLPLVPSGKTPKHPLQVGNVRYSFSGNFLLLD